MRIKFTLALLLFFTLMIFKSFAAYFPDPLLQHFKYNNEKSYAGSGMYFLYNSNKLTNDFVSKFIFGGFIEQDLIDENIYRLNTINYFGNNIGGYLHYSSVGKPFYGFDYSITFTESHLNSIVFTKDIFRLIFKGTSDLRGEKVELSPTRRNMFNHRSLRFSLINDHKIFGLNAKSGGGLEFIAGNRFMDIDIKKSEIEVSNSGDKTEMSLRMNSSITNSEKISWYNINGWGFAFNFFTYIHNEEGRYFYAHIQDAGLVFWDSKTQNANIDTHFILESAEVNSQNFLETPFPVITEEVNETIDKYTDTSSLTIFTPFRLKLSAGSSLPLSNLSVSASFDHYLNFLYKPLYQLALHYEFFPFATVSVMLNHGGFSNFHSGLGLSGFVNERFEYTIGTQNLESLVLKDFKSGMSFYLSIAWHF